MPAMEKNLPGWDQDSVKVSFPFHIIVVMVMVVIMVIEMIMMIRKIKIIRRAKTNTLLLPAPLSRSQRDYQDFR